MAELSIDRVNLRIVGASGHEHRVHGISRRAVELLGERLVDLGPDIRGPDATVASLGVPPVALDLARTDDETCARTVANAMLSAVRLRVGG